MAGGKVQNLALIFKKVPDGFPVPGQDLVVENIGFDLSADLPPNSLSLEVLYLSLDPYQRGRLRGPEVKSYFPGFTLGSPIDNGGLAKVLKSTSDKYKEGDVISAMLPFVQYHVLELEKTAGSPAPPRKIDVTNAPENIGHQLGALGMPGLTAYSSLYEIGKPKKGETIFISSAAGAVGQLVAAISKNEGLTVIGSVGSDEKLKYITEELGYDSGFNYKKEKPGDALARLAPDGIDIYYENVGGEHLEAALNSMKLRGRVVVCGMISQYNSKPEEIYGIKNLMTIVGKRVTMRGFIVSDEEMGPKYFTEHQKNVVAWLKEGKFKAKLHEWDGIEKGGEALVGMLKGENFGKAVLKVKGL